MTKIIYTVTYDNEVLFISDSYFDMREYIYNKFLSDFYDLEREYGCTINEEDCLEYCYELEINWQKFEIKIN